MDDKTYTEMIEPRVQRLESQMTNVFDRLGNVEDKASAAWKTIHEVNKKMEKIEEKVSTLEKDVKDLKVSQNGINKSLKVLIGVVAGLCVVVSGFLVYIWKHDAELAKSILSLGGMIGNIIA